MNTETWRPVPGLEERYEVSDRGAVWSIRRLKCLTPYRAGNGYLRVDLWNGERRIPWHIHRLLAVVFIPQLPGKNEVCHNDGDKLNNSLENLRWDSHRENIKDIVRHGEHHLANKTHCPAGHEYTPENTARWGGGRRSCRACHRRKVPCPVCGESRTAASLQRHIRRIHDVDGRSE